MKPRHPRIAVLAISSFALVAGCAAHTRGTVAVYQPPTTTVQTSGNVATVVQPATAPVVVVPTGRGRAAEIERFTAHMHRRMDDVDAKAQHDLARGHITPTDYADLRNRRQYIDQLISQYSMDGHLRDSEKDHVRDLVDDLEHTADRYDSHRGGGPVYLETR